MPSVQRYIERNHMTWAQFGALIGVSRGAARNIVMGLRKPSVDVLRKMHEATSIPAKTLLYECT